MRDNGTPDDDADLHRFDSPEEAFQYVRRAGTLPDGDIDLGETALALALTLLPGLHVDRYRQHLKKLAGQAREEYLSRLRMKEEDTARLRARVLRKILHEAHGYEADGEKHADLQNASLIRVIERRRGQPVALGILYVDVARKTGWDAAALSFPGHAIVRLEKDGERLVLDPSRGGKEMDAHDLRELLKSALGKGAELSHSYYEPLGNRDLLLRLQNSLKKRLIETEDFAQCLIVIEAMEALAPEEFRLLFDKAVVYVKLGQPRQSIDALERYIAQNPDAREQQQAQMLIRQIQMTMGG